MTDTGAKLMTDTIVLDEALDGFEEQALPATRVAGTGSRCSIGCALIR
jgi:hypothetical protein